MSGNVLPSVNIFTQQVVGLCLSACLSVCICNDLVKSNGRATNRALTHKPCLLLRLVPRKHMKQSTRIARICLCCLERCIAVAYRHNRQLVALYMC